MQQIVVGASATHDITVYVDGTATDLDADPTYTVTGADGTEIVASTTASKQSTGTYRASIPQPTAVDLYTVAWDGDLSSSSWSATTYVEVIGAWLFTIDDLRTFHNSDLASTSTYTTDDIADMRLLITDEFEHICGVSFVGRYEREDVAGTGTRSLDVSKKKISSILECTIGSATQTTSNLVPDPLLPVVHHKTTVFTSATADDPFNVTIAYQHGYDTPPADVTRAALILAHNRLQKDVTGQGVPYAASSWNDGTGQYVTFGANDKTGRWTGLPQVDSVLRRYMLRTPLI